jgi:gamma-glutamyl hercynylcysteine S-oxide synthase
VQEPVQAQGAAVLSNALAIRQVGRDWLSMALMDSRNHLLNRLAENESPAALRRAARVGWFQEHWISCHLQRQRGEASDATAPRLASVEPEIQAWLAEGAAPPVQRLRLYLQETLDTTLELLSGAEDSDQGLYFYRLALLHEDRQLEALVLAQCGLHAQDAPAEPLAEPGTGPGTGPGVRPAAERAHETSAVAAQRAAPLPLPRPQRPPLYLPAQRWQLGSLPAGLVPWAERWAHEVAVPEFEIDAQPVNWQQFVEFAEDGGYDRPELWAPAGWAWLQAQAQQGQARRAPRDVEQLRGGVVVQRRVGGRPVLQRVAAGQPVTQVSRHEAQAWCAWAGRRLPTEPEWELAACTAASRGMAWGDVLEWVAGSARLWPGAGPLPPGMWEAGLGGALHGLQVPGDAAATGTSAGAPAAGLQTGVLRGATFAARARWRHPKARCFAHACDDRGPVGFRSCAM